MALPLMGFKKLYSFFESKTDAKVNNTWVINVLAKITFHTSG